MPAKTGVFDGLLGKVVGPVMARMNREAEREAVMRLAPTADATVLSIGCGPGIGVAELVRAMPHGHIHGVDPSVEMLRQAHRRNRKAIADGRVKLHLVCADEVADLAVQFDGAIAVNTLQLCVPLSVTFAALAASLVPGARFVAITHAWAVRKDHGEIEGWMTQCEDALNTAGFAHVMTGRADAERGQALLVEARR